jgi:hypothetical protein
MGSRRGAANVPGRGLDVCEMAYTYSAKDCGERTQRRVDLAGLVRAAVTKEFKQTPEVIVLSFALDKGPSV